MAICCTPKKPGFISIKRRIIPWSQIMRLVGACSTVSRTKARSLWRVRRQARRMLPQSRKAPKALVPETKIGLRDALRGYRELHLRAFKLLSKDGILATFSCSHHVSEIAFAQTIADALVDARRSARKLRRFEQALDHPVVPTIPETEYFKGLLLEMMPGR